MLNDEQITTIIVMRGLGHTQQEIANSLNISRRTVTTWLGLLKRESKKYGIYKIYCIHVNIVNITLNQVREEIKNKEMNLNGKYTKRD